MTDLEKIRELIIKAITINELNPKSNITIEIGRILTEVNIGLQQYKFDVQGKKNRIDSEILDFERKVKKQFSDMTDTIMELIKLKEYKKTE